MKITFCSSLRPSDLFESSRLRLFDTLTYGSLNTLYPPIHVSTLCETALPLEVALQGQQFGTDNGAHRNNSVQLIGHLNHK